MNSPAVRLWNTLFCRSVISWQMQRCAAYRCHRLAARYLSLLLVYWQAPLPERSDSTHWPIRFREAIQRQTLIGQLRCRSNNSIAKVVQQRAGVIDIQVGKISMSACCISTDTCNKHLKDRNPSVITTDNYNKDFCLSGLLKWFSAS